MSSNVTVVPAAAVPVIVTLGRLIVPPVLVIATNDAGAKTACVVSDDEVSDAVKTLPPTALAELTSNVAGTRLPATFVLLVSEKTVVVGGSLGSIGVLPSAVLVLPVLLFGFVFSVCCGKFGNCSFPASYVPRTC